jgi:hypothetical protein
MHFRVPSKELVKIFNGTANSLDLQESFTSESSGIRELSFLLLLRKVHENGEIKTQSNLEEAS